LGSPRPIIKLHPEEKWAWPLARVAPQYFGVPYNISATVEAIFYLKTLKFAPGCGLPRPTIKLHLEEKVDVALG